MVSTCINCSKEVPNGVELCSYCIENLDEMVDAREMDTTNEVDIQGTVNPFFTSQKLTGGIRSPSKDTVGSIAESSEGSNNFFYIIGFLTIIMIGMINYFI